MHAVEPYRQRAAAVQRYEQAVSHRRPTPSCSGYQRDHGAPGRPSCAPGARRPAATYLVVKNTPGPARHRGQRRWASWRSTSAAPRRWSSPEGPVALAKVLTDFAKDVPAARVQRGGGRRPGRRGRAEIKDDRRRCPSREELIAQAAVPAAVAGHRLARVLARRCRSSSSRFWTRSGKRRSRAPRRSSAGVRDAPPRTKEHRSHRTTDPQS